MPKFAYPVLPCSEIVTILNGAQIAKVNRGQFKKPNRGFVADLYTRLLIYLDTLQEEELGQVDFSALEHLEKHVLLDLHVGSIPFINMYYRIKDVMDSLHFPESPDQFNMRDLIKPDAERTQRFVSAIINFCLHKDTKMNLLRPIVEDLATLDERRKESEDKIAQLNEEIAGYKEARASELPFVQELDNKVKELHQTIAGLNSRQMSLETSYRSLRDKGKEMDEKISKAEFDLVQSIQENANLRSKIVQSPDKLQRALEEKKAAFEGAKNLERSAMQSFQEKTSVLEVYTEALEMMSEHIAQIKPINDQVNSAKSVEKEYNGGKAKLSDDAVLDKSLEAKLIERQRKVEQLDELRSKLEKQRDLKFAESTKELNNVKMDVESRRRNLEARQKKVEDVVAEVDAITSKTNMVKESGAAKVRELVSKGEEIAQEFQLYTKPIWESLAHPVDAQGFESA